MPFTPFKKGSGGKSAVPGKKKAAKKAPAKANPFAKKDVGSVPAGPPPAIAQGMPAGPGGFMPKKPDRDRDGM